MDSEYKFMVTYIRWYKLFMLLITVGGYVLLHFLLSGTAIYAKIPYLPLIIVIAAAAGLYAYIKNTTRKGYENINRILSEKCDPEAYVRVNLYLTQAFSDGKVPPVQDLNLSSGLIAGGSFDEAVGVLKKVSDTSPLYLYNMCLAHIGAGDLKNAEECLRSYRKSAMDTESEEEKKSGMEQYDFLEYCLDVTKGNYNGAADFFRKRYDNSDNTYNRVIAKYYLGEALLAGGDKAAAREAFGYAAENGNKLYAAEKAREKLRNM